MTSRVDFFCIFWSVRVGLFFLFFKRLWPLELMLFCLGHFDSFCLTYVMALVELTDFTFSISFLFSRRLCSFEFYCAFHDYYFCLPLSFFQRVLMTSRVDFICIFWSLRVGLFFLFFKRLWPLELMLFCLGHFDSFCLTYLMALVELTDFTFSISFLFSRRAAV